MYVFRSMTPLCINFTFSSSPQKPLHCFKKYLHTPTNQSTTQKFCQHLSFPDLPERQKQELSSHHTLSLQWTGSSDEAVLNSHWLRNWSSARGCCWFKGQRNWAGVTWQCTKRNFHVVKNLPLCLILALFPTSLLRKNELSSHSSGASFAPWMNILQVQIKCSTAAIYSLSLAKRIAGSQAFVSGAGSKCVTAKTPCQVQVPLLLLPFAFCEVIAIRLHMGHISMVLVLHILSDLYYCKCLHDSSSR